MSCWGERVHSGNASRLIDGYGPRRSGAISFDTSSLIPCVQISRRSQDYFDIRARLQVARAAYDWSVYFFLDSQAKAYATYCEPERRLSDWASLRSSSCADSGTIRQLLSASA